MFITHYLNLLEGDRNRTNLPGMDAFARAFPVKRKLLIGSQGITLHDFFLAPPEQWLERKLDST